MKLRRMLYQIVALLLIGLAMISVAMADSAFSFLPQRTYAGQTYEARPPAELTTVLLIGYDHYNSGAIEELHGYNRGGQADFQLLLVVDHLKETVRVLQIDRDTMTKVRVMNVQGKHFIRPSLQICLAHAYGDTRESNNANAILAVETLMSIDKPDDGVGIDWYVAMDISGISKLNDLLGGVTVTLLDDLSQYDSEMKKGATLQLTGKQAELYCRGRYGVGDQTNASRMVRQQQYISAAADQLRSLIKADPGYANRLLDGMGILYDRTVVSNDPFSFADNSVGTSVEGGTGYYLMSSEIKSGIVALMSRAISYKVLETETLPGEHILSSDGYIHFIPEANAAIEWTLNAFYRETK